MHCLGAHTENVFTEVNVFSTTLTQAFEHLVALEFVCPSESGGVAHSMTHHHSGKVMKEFQPMILMLEGEQIKKAVQNYPNCPTDIARWGTSSAMVS